MDSSRKAQQHTHGREYASRQTRGAVLRHPQEAVVIALPQEWPGRGAGPWSQIDLIASLASSTGRLVLDLNDLRELDGETAAVLVALRDIVSDERADIRLAVEREHDPAADMAIARLRRVYGVYATADEALDAIADAA